MKTPEKYLNIRTKLLDAIRTIGRRDTDINRLKCEIAIERKKSSKLEESANGLAEAVVRQACRIADLELQIHSEKKDAARYRWMRSVESDWEAAEIVVLGPAGCVALCEESLDTAIDAEIAKEPACES